MLFWTYSNTVYQKPGVPQGCLILQNQFGMDVNMVLFCCWHGISRGVIDPGLFQQCINFSRTWSSHTVKPLRGIRTWLKDNGCPEFSFDTDTCMSYRDRVKAVELESEKLQQITLESYCQKSPVKQQTDRDSSIAAAENLRRYLEAEKITLTETAIEAMLLIIEASLAQADSHAFRSTLSGQAD